MDILAIVKGQRMKLTANNSCHISGSNRFVRFRFEMSDEWKNLSVIAMFEQNGKIFSETVTDGCAFLPSDICEGNCDMTLFGVGGTIFATTNRVPLIIKNDISNMLTN